MQDQSNPVKTTKKQYHKPDFWVIDSYVAGGAGANVNEATAQTTYSSHPAHAGSPGVHVHKAGNYFVQSVNWTAAHS